MGSSCPAYYTVTGWPSDVPPRMLCLRERGHFGAHSDVSGWLWVSRGLELTSDQVQRFTDGEWGLARRLVVEALENAGFAPPKVDFDLGDESYLRETRLGAGLDAAGLARFLRAVRQRLEVARPIGGDDMSGATVWDVVTEVKNWMSERGLFHTWLDAAPDGPVAP